MKSFYDKRLAVLQLRDPGGRVPGVPNTKVWNIQLLQAVCIEHVIYKTHSLREKKKKKIVLFCFSGNWLTSCVWFWYCIKTLWEGEITWKPQERSWVGITVLYQIPVLLFLNKALYIVVLRIFTEQSIPWLKIHFLKNTTELLWCLKKKKLQEGNST